MKQDELKALTNAELDLVIGWADAEKKARAEKHKQETIAKIRELAQSIEVGVKIDGMRGRPAQHRKPNVQIKRDSRTSSTTSRNSHLP